MIHWQTVKEFFGFGTTTAVDETAGHSYTPPPPPPRPLTEGKTLSAVKTQTNKTAPNTPPPAGRPPIKKTSLRARNYYRRNGRFYSSIDDGLIEDVLMLIAIQELFDDGDIREYQGELQEYNVPETNIFGNEAEVEPVEDLLDIDVSETPVVHLDTVSTPEPTYVAPEPTPEPERVSAGSSYSSGSSDSYDSGGSDSGGGDD